MSYLLYNLYTPVIYIFQNNCKIYFDYVEIINILIEKSNNNKNVFCQLQKEKAF